MPFRGIPCWDLPLERQEQARQKLKRHHWSLSPNRQRIIEQIRNGRFGENNPHWKGDSVNKVTAEDRARRMYPYHKPCQMCGKIKTERHHKDENAWNNEAKNIMWLCRSCHMRLDGRIHNLRHN